MKNIIILLFVACLSGMTAYAQAPTIMSFSPSGGPIGTLVTITGTNLSSPTAFTIGGATAVVVSDDGTTLVGMVMPGAATGTLSLTTSGGTATSSGSYTVAASSLPDVQQGSKLVGMGAQGAAEQGISVALSADGNTALVGGFTDSNLVGAAWVYVRTGGIWSQQGPKLVGTGAIGQARQGESVALSADGNTAILGGPYDNNRAGAAWIFTRSGGAWTQQGAKLIGTGAINDTAGGGPGAAQGFSVALSADGNTAMIGAFADNIDSGAVWIFTRSGGIWTQQGAKLVGTGSIAGGAQGYSVSLSADGNTALDGGWGDNYSLGAVWVFTRSGGIWSQQGPKLVGTGAVGGPRQGVSVSLSADGNTALVGGYQDSSNTGAAWVYTRSGSAWSQQGGKIVGTGGTTSANQGYAVSLSADGNTALIGAPNDNNGIGASWLFERAGGIWTQQGNKMLGTGTTGVIVGQGESVALSADGNTAIVGAFYDNIHTGAVWVYTSLASGIAEVSAPGYVSLHPNPNNGSFTLETSGATGGEYSIYDIIGRPMAIAAIISDSQPVMLSFAPGAYFISIRTQTGVVSTVRYDVVK